MTYITYLLRIYLHWHCRFILPGQHLHFGHLEPGRSSLLASTTTTTATTRGPTIPCALPWPCSVRGGRSGGGGGSGGGVSTGYGGRGEKWTYCGAVFVGLGGWGANGGRQKGVSLTWNVKTPCNCHQLRHKYCEFRPHQKAINFNDNTVINQLANKRRGESTIFHTFI